MKPSARLKTAQDLLEHFFKDPSYPLDLIANHHFRKNRYIGGGDRRAIQDTLYKIIRNYLALDWALRAVGGTPNSRSILLTHLVQTGGFEEALFAEGGYGLPPLTDGEGALVKALGNLSEKAPDWARLNCPEWLLGRFQSRFPKTWEKELNVLKGRAPLTIRINTLKARPKELSADLKALGFEPTSFSPLGFSSTEHVNLVPLQIFQDGLIEIQDEGSQIAALLVDARPGMQVLDLCAGAGGKTLSAAAEMANSGQIYAFDINEKRLNELAKRVQKAGARNVQGAVLPLKGRDEFLAPLAGTMDRVILDLPCSGSGTWRRSPDQRFGLTKEKLAGTIATQKALLAEGAALVKPGGRLIYITCSFFQAEAEDQVSAFLDGHAGWGLLDYRGILERRDIKTIPDSASSLKGTLLLTPGRHGTDGFFVALLEKP